MAKVRSPLHSIDLRGRIADGFVFTVWRGINCLRTFVMPSQTRTQRREQVWKTTPVVSRAWAGLTDGERAAWEAFTFLVKPTDPTLGRESHWTGYSAYVSVNRVLADAGLALVNQPPAIPLPNPPERFRLRNPSPGVVRIRWEPLPAGTLIDLWLNQTKASRKAYPSRFRHLVYADGTTGLLALSDIPAETRMAVKARVVRPDGGRSGYAQGEIVI
jgi:hypothetical protein